MTAPTFRRPGQLTVLLAALAALLTAAVVALVIRSATPTYTSTALVAIDEPVAVSVAGDGGILDKLSKLRYKYAGLVVTDRLAAPVAVRLKVPVTAVRGRLSAQLVPSDLLIRLSCRGDSPASARTCADALASAMVVYVSQEQTSNKIARDQQVVVSQVQPAVQVAVTGPRRGRTIGLAGFAGLLAAGVILAVATRLRD